MHSLSGLEISILVKEFENLEGAYIEKFYEIDKNIFRIRLKKESQINIECNIPNSIYRTRIIKHAETASNFAIAVRKHITNFKINKIYQLNNDRIIVFNIKSRDSEKNLIFEFFGKGNFIITDSEMKILLCYNMHNFKDRQVRPGIKYIFPKNDFVGNDISFFNSNFSKLKEQFIKHATENKKETFNHNQKLILFITKYLNFGPIYIEDALLRYGIDPKQDLLKIDNDKLIIDALATKFSNVNAVPIVYLKDNTIIDYSLLSLKKYENLETKKFNTFNELLDYIGENIVQANNLYSETQTAEIEEIENSIKKQKRLFEQNKKDMQNAKSAGEIIFRNMQLINLMLDETRSNKKISMNELNNLFPELKVLNIDLKKKIIIIDI